jgi:hypothetical protein
MTVPATRTVRLDQAQRSAPPARRRSDRTLPAELSRTSDGAVIERLIRMRVACKALAIELAETRNELKAVRAELHRVKRRYGEG